MSERHLIVASPRDRAGKGSARATRRADKVPAVIYGDKKEPEIITLDRGDLRKTIARGHFLSTIVDIEVAGVKQRVLPRDVQLHPVTDMPLHVDFLRIGVGSKITVSVPVHVMNADRAPGVKNGGVVNIVRHEIELKASPDAIPSEITVDLTGRQIGDSIHMNDIALPEGVTPTDRRNFTVVTLAAPTVEQAAPAAEEAAG